MISNNTYSKTRIQRLLDGLFFVKKGNGLYVQHMLKMSKSLYTGGNFKQIFGKINDGKLGTLFTIMI